MNNMIVTFEISNESSDYRQFISHIKSFPAWAQISQNTFYIKTIKTSEELANSLWRFMYSNDSLCVFSISSGSWYLSEDMSNFLANTWDN